MTLVVGDCRATLARWAAEGVRAQTCVTSPPYWGLRDYGMPGQLGLEKTPEEYVANLVDMFRLVRDVLADDGTLWLNLGDSYARSPEKSGPNGRSATGTPNGRNIVAMGYKGLKDIPPGLKPKDLVGIPWRVAFALQADGWYLRSDIIWAKPNPMPESVTDRPTKAHEYLFLLTKRERYYYDAEAVREPYVSRPTVSVRVVVDPKGTAQPHGGPVGRGGSHATEEHYKHEGRNRRSVWTIATAPYSDAHFATFPPDLVTPCILAGSRPGDPVLDPFMGAGTVAMVAQDLGRAWLGCELSAEYAALCERRTRQQGLVLTPNALTPDG